MHRCAILLPTLLILLLSVSTASAVGIGQTLTYEEVGFFAAVGDVGSIEPTVCPCSGPGLATYIVTAIVPGTAGELQTINFTNGGGSVYTTSTGNNMVPTTGFGGGILDVIASAGAITEGQFSDPAIGFGFAPGDTGYIEGFEAPNLSYNDVNAPYFATYIVGDVNDFGSLNGPLTASGGNDGTFADPYSTCADADAVPVTGTGNGAILIIATDNSLEPPMDTTALGEFGYVIYADPMVNISGANYAVGDIGQVWELDPLIQVGTYIVTETDFYNTVSLNGFQLALTHGYFPGEMESFIDTGFGNGVLFFNVFLGGGLPPALF